MNLTLPLAATAPSYWPFAILAIAVTFIIVAITKLRMHAFLALILAAFLTGFLTPAFNAATLAKLPATMLSDARTNSWIAAVEITALEFGNAAGTIAISIGLASIIGLCLMESGAADKVVRRFLAVFGEKRAGLALLASTYVLSIPIFFDTMFMLMVPLARALALRTGKNYLLYIMAVCGAAVITHTLTVPHPGPLAMVDNLHVDPGLSLLWGLVAGLLPCLICYGLVKWLDHRLRVPLRETPGAALSELAKITQKPEHELPSFGASVAPVLLPIFLISAGSFIKVLADYPTAINALGGPHGFAAISKVALFIGNKNIALLIGTTIGLIVLARQRQISLGTVEELLGPPIATAATIILITAAGGAFGGNAPPCRRGRCDQSLSRYLRDRSSPPRLGHSGRPENRPRIHHRRTHRRLIDPLANDGPRSECPAPLSSDVRLSRHRLRRPIRLMDERQRLLGREQTRRPHRKGNSQKLDGTAWRHRGLRPIGRASGLPPPAAQLTAGPPWRTPAAPRPAPDHGGPT